MLKQQFGGNFSRVSLIHDSWFDDFSGSHDFHGWPLKVWVRCIEDVHELILRLVEGAEASSEGPLPAFARPGRESRG